tara:strand:+ start:1327 stop:1740 length:414 start_codon:yes stop_codon:yes gene_type:complete
MAQSWMAIEIDRDFYTNSYGEGVPRLYLNVDPHSYVLIKSSTYDKENQVLTVVDNNGNTHVLSNEPDGELFKNTIYLDWTNFDRDFFERWGYDKENRSDYEPWMYNSIEALAYELKLYDEFTGKMYFGKEIMVKGDE